MNSVRTTGKLPYLGTGLRKSQPNAVFKATSIGPPLNRPKKERPPLVIDSSTQVLPTLFLSQHHANIISASPTISYNCSPSDLKGPQRKLDRRARDPPLFARRLQIAYEDKWKQSSLSWRCLASGHSGLPTLQVHDLGNEWPKQIRQGKPGPSFKGHILYIIYESKI